MTQPLYNSSLWRHVRAAALARDGGRCSVSRLLGGQCAAGPLHVHHIHAVEDGGPRFDLDNLGTTCAAHHPMWEALRRYIVREALDQPQPRRCHHRHTSRHAREQCERRLARTTVAA